MKRQLHFILFFILLAGFPVLPAASQGQPLSLSLDQARNYAMENNYSLKNATIDTEIARKKVKENIAQGFPQISGNIDYNYFISLPTSLIPGDFFGQPGESIEVQFGTKHNLNLDVTLNQLIFDGRYFIGLQYARIFRQMSEELLIKSEQDVKEMVTGTYYTVLIAEESKRILDSLLNVLEKTRYEVGEMYHEGFLEATDYDQLTLTLAEVRNEANTLERQVALGYALLKYQLGLDDAQEVILTQSLDELLLLSSDEALLAARFDHTGHIDYRLLASQEKMKVLALQNEQSAYYPSLTGYLNFQENAQRDNFNFLRKGYPWFYTSSFGVSMNIPIFTSGIRLYRTQQARLELEKIRNSKEQLARGLQLSVEQARSEFNTALENYIRDKENIGLAMRIYRNTLVKYGEGMATSAELTQQHQQYINAESKYFQTVFALLTARNKLDKALGVY